MAELGMESIYEHEQIIQLIGTNKWKEVVLVGGDFLKIKHPYQSFNNAGEAGEWLSSRHFQNTAFLVKGSRSMEMERVLKGFTQKA
jgi:UDP-N-acetylmuramoyl-tripeptide--D-alanyl-D-alanine ligase